MVCLGLKPGAARWKAHTNPLSYGGTLSIKLPRQLINIFHLWSSLAEGEDRIDLTAKYV